MENKLILRKALLELKSLLYRINLDCKRISSVSPNSDLWNPRPGISFRVKNSRRAADLSRVAGKMMRAYYCLEGLSLCDKILL